MSLTKYIKTKDSIKQELRELSQAYNRYHIIILKSNDKELVRLEKALSDCITELEVIANKRFNRLNKIRKEIQNGKNDSM